LSYADFSNIRINKMQICTDFILIKIAWGLH
jgi:hypothetical protein